MKREVSRFAVLTALASMLFLGAAQAQASDWDGTWTGSWGGISPCSMTFAHGRLVRSSYKGKPSPITVSKVEGNSVTFGVPNVYAIRIERTGSNTATATYEAFRGSQIVDTAAADLTKQ